MKKRITRRIFAALLAIGMLVTLPAGALADESAVTEDTSSLLAEEGGAFTDEDYVDILENTVSADADTSASDPEIPADADDTAASSEVKPGDAAEPEAFVEEIPGDDAEPEIPAAEEGSQENLSEEENALSEEESVSQVKLLEEEALSGLIEEAAEEDAVVEEETGESISEEALGEPGFDGKSVLIYKKQKRTVLHLFLQNCQIKGLPFADIVGYRIPKKYQKYASITKNGMLTAKKAGDFQVTAYDKDKKEILTLDFTALNPSFKFPTVNSLTDDFRAKDYLYDYQRPESTDTPESGMPVRTYSSSNEAVAEIDSGTGVLTFHKAGTTTITVTFAGKQSEISDEIWPVSVKAKLKVKLPKLNKTLISLKPGKSTTIKLTGIIGDREVSWPTNSTHFVFEPYGKNNANCKVTATSDESKLTSSFTYCWIGADRFYFGACITENNNFPYGYPGGTINAKYDMKKMTEFLCKVNFYRLSLGRKPLQWNTNMWNDVIYRVKEMPYSPKGLRPNGTDPAVTAFGQSGYTLLWSSEWCAPGKMADLYKKCRKDTEFVKAMDDPEAKYLNVCVLKTKSSYKVGKNKYKEFMVLALGN